MSSDSSSETNNEKHNTSKRRKITLPIRYQNITSFITTSSDDENQCVDSGIISFNIPSLDDFGLQKDSQITSSPTTSNKNATIQSEVYTEKSKSPTIQSEVNVEKSKSLRVQTEVNPEKSKNATIQNKINAENSKFKIYKKLCSTCK